MEFFCYNNKKLVHTFVVLDSSIVEKYGNNKMDVFNITLEEALQLEKMFKQIFLRKEMMMENERLTFSPAVNRSKEMFEKITGKTYEQYQSDFLSQYHQFASELMTKLVSSKNSDENIIINSLESAYFANLCALLQYKNYKNLHNLEYFKFLRKIDGVKNFEAIFVLDPEKVPKYLRLVSKNICKIDNNSKNKINEKVETETKGLIKTLIDYEMSQTDMSLAIFGTTYIDQLWRVPFTGSGPQIFYLNEKETYHTETLQAENYYLSVDTDYNDRYLISIPLWNGLFRFFIEMPIEYGKKISFRSEIIEKFNTIYPKKKEKVFMPKFSLDSEFDLKDMLLKMGYPVNENILALGSDRDRIDVLKQKTNLTVSEKGFVAASATALSATRGLNFNSIIINKPFYIWITYENLLIFQAYIQRPHRSF